VRPESTAPRSTPPAFRVTATLVPVGQAGKAKSSAQFEPASMNRMLCCVCKTMSVMSGDVLHVCVQAQLEEVLFSIIREKGFDEAHIDCYRMVTQFYQSRQPLCIIICGAAWTGGCWARQGSTTSQCCLRLVQRRAEARADACVSQQVPCTGRPAWMTPGCMQVRSVSIRTSCCSCTATRCRHCCPRAPRCMSVVSCQPTL
jgi:hypothetical protein